MPTGSASLLAPVVQVRPKWLERSSALWVPLSCGAAGLAERVTKLFSSWQHEGCGHFCKRYKLYYDDGLSGPYTEAAIE